MITVDDEVPKFSKCPRCGERGYDVLATSALCVNCLYSPDFDNIYEDHSIPPWALSTFKEVKLPSLNIPLDEPETPPQPQEAS